MEIEKALKELRNEKKRKFIQTLDLIINLQNFDARKESINTFVELPNSPEKKICAFLTKKSKIVDTITKEEFDRYKNQRDIKRLAKKYDFFIAVAPLMSSVATKFGRILGPSGKMPSPQAGIMPNDDDNSVKNMTDRMKKLVRIKSKEKTLKIPVGKESMSDKELKENIEVIVNSLENVLPRKKDNIKNIMIKFSMTKSIKISE
ncbi:MAG: hypothetical protein ACOYT4_01065 [Nanoarchaeota archaeon]